jgi:hypothetical protein
MTQEILGHARERCALSCPIDGGAYPALPANGGRLIAGRAPVDASGYCMFMPKAIVVRDVSR